MLPVLKSITRVVYLLLLVISTAYADPDKKVLEYKVKAAYLYNFTKFVTWPEKALGESSDEPLTICILGEDPFGHSIDLLSNKTSKGRQVDVVYLASLENSDTCHVMFISRSESSRLEDILHTLDDRHILTVSDIDEFAMKGGCIRLDVVNGKVRFNINVETARRAQLEMSAKLLELARVVIE